MLASTKPQILVGAFFYQTVNDGLFAFSGLDNDRQYRSKRQRRRDRWRQPDALSRPVPFAADITHKPLHTFSR